MLPELTEYLRRDWDALFPGVFAPIDIDYLGMPGAVEGRTTTFLAYSTQPEPLFVVKVYRSPEDAARAEQERMVLSHLRQHASMLPGAAPRVVWAGRVGLSSVIVQAVASGRSMTVRMRRDGLPDPHTFELHLSLVREWLVAVSRLPLLEPQAQDPGDAALSLIDDFRRVFDCNVEERRLLRELSASIRDVVSRWTPLMHGDFCRQNLLLTSRGTESRMTVIDWSDSTYPAFPSHDLLFFVTTYFTQARPAAGFDSWLQAFSETFDRTNRHGFAVRKCLDSYCARVGVPFDLRTYLGLFLIQQSLREAAKLEFLSRTLPLPRMAVWLAQQTGATYPQARVLSIWRCFFRHLASARSGLESILN